MESGLRLVIACKDTSPHRQFETYCFHQTVLPLRPERDPREKNGWFQRAAFRISYPSLGAPHFQSHSHHSLQEQEGNTHILVDAAIAPLVLILPFRSSRRVHRNGFVLRMYGWTKFPRDPYTLYTHGTHYGGRLRNTFHSSVVLQRCMDCASTARTFSCRVPKSYNG